MQQKRQGLGLDPGRLAPGTRAVTPWHIERTFDFYALMPAIAGRPRVHHPRLALSDPPCWILPPRGKVPSLLSILANLANIGSFLLAIYLVIRGNDDARRGRQVQEQNHNEAASQPTTYKPETNPQVYRPSKDAIRDRTTRLWWGDDLSDDAIIDEYLQVRKLSCILIGVAALFSLSGLYNGTFSIMAPPSSVLALVASAFLWRARARLARRFRPVT